MEARGLRLTPRAAPSEAEFTCWSCRHVRHAPGTASGLWCGPGKREARQRCPDFDREPGADEVERFPAPTGAPLEHTHRCPWPGCAVHVPTNLWGCKPHWLSLPLELRARIWHAYRRRQGEPGGPPISDEYLAALAEARTWMAFIRGEGQQQRQGHGDA